MKSVSVEILTNGVTSDFKIPPHICKFDVLEHEDFNSFSFY
jgi:hypothetical protein